VVAELLQCSDAGQVCVSLRGALKAASEDSVAEKMCVQLALQRGRCAEQRPIEARGQVAVDDLLCSSQDEHASQARELCCSLFSQSALLLLAETDSKSGLMPDTVVSCHKREVALPLSRRAVWSVELAPRILFCMRWTTRESLG